MVGVIMAGGEGVRCRPLTLTTPKPMLPVGGKPLLDTLVTQLERAGCDPVYVVVRYLREQIEAYFGDRVQYLNEPEPWGTAGGLCLLPPQTEPFLVVNGDLLTPINFRDLWWFHRKGSYRLTLVRRFHAVTIPYGYPIVSKDRVLSFEEKPTFGYRVNSGIYCLNPGLLRDVKPPMDMPALIRAAGTGGMVGAYLLEQPFHEIGTPESYAAAERFYEEHMRGE